MSQDIVRDLKSAVEMREGRGARVRRLFPTGDFQSFDPFVLFDEFYVEKPAGFPMHRHSGFEFITYMIEGVIVHEDSLDNRAEIPVGGIQHAITGKGIRHSEMPGTDGMNQGIQLWVNLPKVMKGTEPTYEIFSPDDLKKESFEGGKAIFISEDSDLVVSTPVDYLDLELEFGKIYKGKIPEDFNTLIYVLKGKLKIGDINVKPHQAAILNPGKELIAEMMEDSRFIYLSGKPLEEEIKLRGSQVE
jgi:hypothetical protein